MQFLAQLLHLLHLFRIQLGHGGLRQLQRRVGHAAPELPEQRTDHRLVHIEALVLLHQQGRQMIRHQLAPLLAQKDALVHQNHKGIEQCGQRPLLRRDDMGRPAQLGRRGGGDPLPQRPLQSWRLPKLRRLDAGALRLGGRFLRRLACRAPQQYSHGRHVPQLIHQLPAVLAVNFSPLTVQPQPLDCLLHGLALLRRYILLHHKQLPKHLVHRDGGGAKLRLKLLLGLLPIALDTVQLSLPARTAHCRLRQLLQNSQIRLERLQRYILNDRFAVVGVLIAYLNGLTEDMAVLPLGSGRLPLPILSLNGSGKILYMKLFKKIQAVCGKNRLPVPLL